MRHGISLPESVANPHLIGAAIDRLPARPNVVAVWANHLTLDAKALTGIRQCKARGIGVVIYAESNRPMTYAAILAGDHDATIDGLARELLKFGRIIVRLDQEPNGSFGAPWTEAEGVTPETYIAGWTYMSERIRAIAPEARMAFCITWRGLKHADDFARLYPGDACQVVGFDSYIKSARVRLPRIWTSARRTIRKTTGKPIRVFEWAIEKGVPHRPRIMRSTSEVKGIEAAMYFDIDLMHRGVPHRWSMGRIEPPSRLRREFARMSA